VDNKNIHVIDIHKGIYLICSACSWQTGLSNLVHPCSINRSIEPTNEIMKFIDNIQQDNAIVVIENLNHEVICIILFWLKGKNWNTDLSYAIWPIIFAFS
jgi:hypothetical protein